MEGILKFPALKALLKYHFKANTWKEMKTARRRPILPRGNDMEVICWDRPATCQRRQSRFNKDFLKDDQADQGSLSP